MNNKKCVDIIYVDVVKSFDVVSHEKLLHKLHKKHSISNKIIQWFYNSVSNRSQITWVENYFSNSSILKSGVPQGSVVFPMLSILSYKICSYDFREGTYFINNIKLENVTFYEDLGIIFENNHLINTYIDYICKKKLIFL